MSLVRNIPLRHYLLGGIALALLCTPLSLRAQEQDRTETNINASLRDRIEQRIRVNTERDNSTASGTIRAQVRATTTPPNRAEQNTRGQEVRAEVQERNTERREALQARLNEQAKKRIEAYVHRMTLRFEATVERFRSIAERIADRIEKLSDERGADITEVARLLLIADDKITDAEQAILSMQTTIAAMLAADTEISFADIRSEIKLTVAALKEAHRALRDTLVALKASTSAEAEVEAEEEEEEEVDTETF